MLHIINYNFPSVSETSAENKFPNSTGHKVSLEGKWKHPFLSYKIKMLLIFLSRRNKVENACVIL